jgi:hypothetical protein
VPAIQEACAAHGIEVEMAGTSAGRSVARPEQALRAVDLVFAKAKAALEAMCVGAAVVLCDVAGAGPMVTTANLDQLRRVNFGMRALRHPCTPDFPAEQIARYDAADARAVSGAVRAAAGTPAMVDELCALYADVIAEYDALQAADPNAESRAAARYLQGLSSRLYERDLLAGVFQALLRKPVLGPMVRRAGASRRAWIAELLEIRGMDGA